MTRKIFSIFMNLFIFISVVATVDGLNVRQGIFGYVTLGLIFGVGMMFVPTVLKFFKLPVNFAGRLLVGSLVSILIFVSFRYLILGLIDFQATVVGGDVVSWLTLPRLELDKFGTVVYGAIISALLSSAMAQLKSSNSK